MDISIDVFRWRKRNDHTDDDVFCKDRSISIDGGLIIKSAWKTQMMRMDIEINERTDHSNRDTTDNH